MGTDPGRSDPTRVEEPLYEPYPYAVARPLLPQPARPPRSGPSKATRLLAALAVVMLLVVGLFLVGGATLSSGQDDGTSVEQVWYEDEEPAEDQELEDDPQSSSARVGDVVDVTGQDGEVEVTVLSAKWVSTEDDHSKSGRFLILDVSIEGVNGALDYRPKMFTVVDRAGRVYEVTERADVNPILRSGTMNEGERARGYLAFDVKKSDVTLTIENDLSQESARVEIPG